jgi:hypothetical protein
MASINTLKLSRSPDLMNGSGKPFKIFHRRDHFYGGGISVDDEAVGDMLPVVLGYQNDIREDLNQWLG